MSAPTQIAIRRFSVDPWSFRDDRTSSTIFDKQDIQAVEAIMTQGNGFIGTRGATEEPMDENEWHSFSATFLNGVYGCVENKYTWRRHGLSPEGEFTLRVPCWQRIQIEVNGETFHMRHGEVIDHQRTLDMKNGVLTRTLEWVSPQGIRVVLHFERLVSMTRLHAATTRLRVRAIDAAQIRVVSGLNADVHNMLPYEQFLELRTGRVNDQTISLDLFAESSELSVAEAVSMRCSGCTGEGAVEGLNHFCTFTRDLAAGEELVFEKFAALYGGPEDPQQLAQAEAEADQLAEVGFDTLLAENKTWWSSFWQGADIEIDDQEELQQGIRYGMFQLTQQTGRDGKTNIGAKGLSGYLYYGKAFWDTEVYMLPSLTNADPMIGKSLLNFRYNTLEQARDHAKNLGYRGALFPWETISGKESAFIYEASTAQYHINTAIAHAISRYHMVTADNEWLFGKGAELLIELCRTLRSVGCFIEGKGFCLNGVCGPDEYSPMIDNNAYTNVMTAWTFRYCLDVLDRYQTADALACTALCDRLGWTAEERTDLQKAADEIFVPSDEDKGILLAYDGYLGREDLTREAFHKRYPDGYGESFMINFWRTQIIKQADTVLLLYLRSRDFDRDLKARTYDFYEPRTLHSSSLSACIHAIVASDIGRTDLLSSYLDYALRMQIDDIQGNVCAGLQTAAMGGAWQVVVHGIGGVIMQDDELSINPHLPEGWTGLRFKLRWAGCQMQVQISTEATTATLLTGPGCSFTLIDQEITLSPDQPNVRTNHKG